MQRPRFRAFADWSLLPAAILLSTNLLLCTAAAQTELGSEDDLTVLGVDGTAADPDVELKGFTVFGSTQPAYTGAGAGPGNVVVNGVLAVSSGAYFVGNSTFTSAGKIFITDGSSGQLLRRTSSGSMEWTDGTALGDNLGNHVATTTLNMASWDMVNVSSVNFKSNVFISSATAAQLGGVYVSSNMFVAGISSATSYYGDGSTLTGVSTDTLKIGDSYGGGIVFWVDAKGRNALIAPTADQSLPSIQWAPTTGFTGAGLEGVYAGKANTVMISTRTGPGSYAARLCQDYAATVGGIYYDDWYLPSKTELQLLYAQKDVVGGFTTGAYWSSTEYVPNTTNAWYVDFSNGNVSNYFKTSPNYVRCVRGGPFSAFDHSRDAETVRNGAYVTSTQTFTGGNTFAAVTASSYTATGIGVQAAQLRFNPAAPNIVISSEASAALGGGVRVSTNVYIVGFASATKFYGDGSGLTNLPQGAGDNLGNHIATAVLQMGAYGVNSSSDITAARYQIGGSTVLAILPGFGSLGVGTDAGKVNTGNFNSFVGFQAGNSNTAGGYNSFLGLQAGYYNTTGIQNSFVGFQAGYYNTTASNNSFVGNEAGFSNTTGASNSFVGAAAGHNNTTGAGNSFVGVAAGYYNTTASNNSFLGRAAGNANTTGGSNSFMGYQAGVSNQTGSGNAILGYNAGYGVSLNSYSSNTLVGYQSGFGLATGSDNTFLGWQSGYNVTTGTGNIIIGYDKRTSAPSASNELNIGGVLYGDLSAKTIGISTRVPQAALDVVSTGTLVSQYAQVWRDSTGLVVASMTANGKLTTLQALPGDNLGSHIATTTLDMAGFAISGAGPVTASSATITGNAFSVGGSTLAVSAGNVGVGTDAPAYKLEVKDAGMAGFQVQPQAGYISLRINGTEVARLKP